VTKAPWHLWLVGVIALLFNSVGVYDYLMTMTQGTVYLANAGFTPEQIAHYEAYPVWMTAVWAIGVWGAFVASVLLLLRRRYAWVVFAISLAAFLVNLLYNYVLTDGGDLLGSGMAITSAVITVLLIFFTWYSRMMANRSVLR
jgi:hypothetical protein